MKPTKQNAKHLLLIARRRLTEALADLEIAKLTVRQAQAQVAECEGLCAEAGCSTTEVANS